MEHDNNVMEEITTGVESITLDIPVRVRLTSINDSPFEFTTSIDEIGQIVLTPTSKEVTFEHANTENDVEFEIPVIEQETIITNEDDLTIKETSILIRANMLKEDNNIDINAVVDEIGQCIIYPVAKNNIFVSASVEDNLNLVTEELQVVDYFGYQLINTGDGWDIKDYTGEIIETGVATESEAKIVVCTTEIHRLEALTEEVDTAENTTEEVPEITAEVVEESVTEYPVEPTEDSESVIQQKLSELTENFSEDAGAVRCDTLSERSTCVQILQQYYSDVTCDNKIDYHIITYRR